MRYLAACSLFVLLAACGDSESATTATTATTTTSAASGGAGGTTSTGGAGGGTPECEGGAPVTAPEETWTFVPVDGTVCGAAGTTSGFFINPTAQSARLFIVLSGGGACFSQTDCQSVNLNGFDPMQGINQLSQTPLFNRADPANPFSDFSYVFIPYCNGDFHSGNNVASYGMQHMGYANMEKYLELIVPTFCEADHVVLSGMSAGSFGATFNYDLVHRAFGSRPVDLIADSGPYMRPPHMPSDMQAAIDDNWGFRANMPAGCSGCTTSWHELYAFIATTYPNDRMSLISSLRDPSIQGRFAPYTPLDTLDAFEVAINDLADGVITPLSNFRVFYLPQQGHVWLTSGQLDQLVVNNVSLEQFVRQQIDDDPGWTNVRP